MSDLTLDDNKAFIKIIKQCSQCPDCEDEEDVGHGCMMWTTCKALNKEIHGGSFTKNKNFPDFCPLRNASDILEVHRLSETVIEQLMKMETKLTTTDIIMVIRVMLADDIMREAIHMSIHDRERVKNDKTPRANN